VHDDPEVTPPDKVRYDACLVVDAPLKPEGDVGVQEISGGDYATATHQGPYEKLGETYARLCGEWLPGSGRELRSAPSLEIYRNSPMNTAPENLLTDVYLPLESGR
jgi:AraC family transcriptional regulator